MNYILLDLEWHTVYSKRHNSYINEIIEFGAVKLNDNLETIDTFQCFIRSCITNTLSKLCMEITNLTNKDMLSGVELKVACSEFRKWCGNNVVIITFSNSDVHTLIQNYNFFLNKSKISFLHYYIDLQEYLHLYFQLDTSVAISLVKAAELSSIKTDHLNLHRALDDSLLCAEILRNTFNKTIINKTLQNANYTDFYDKLLFKSYYTNDLADPLINREHLMFKCEKCNKFAKRKENWKLKNKTFSASFTCRHCNSTFTGFVKLKRNYDHIVVKRKKVDLVH